MGLKLKLLRNTQLLFPQNQPLDGMGWGVREREREREGERGESHVLL